MVVFYAVPKEVELQDTERVLVRRTFKYRLMASDAVLDKTEQWLGLCCYLYNVALLERIQNYRQGKEFHYFDQCREIPELRESFLEYGEIDSQLLREVLRRLDRSFNQFFKRRETGNKVGFPRFKNKNRYKSLTLQHNGWKLDGKFLSIKKLGRFKIRLSRPIEGEIKTVTIKKVLDKWYVYFSCVCDRNKFISSNDSVGIDLGIKFLCADSASNKFNVLYDKTSEKLMRRKQRSLSRKRKGSTNWKERSLLVGKLYEKIKNQRYDCFHKIANYYVRNYGNIFVENLNIREMIKDKYFAKNIHDSSWGKFFQILSYKAEEAGRKVTKVNPQYTSQRCSECGSINLDLKLYQRIWMCSVCGATHDRDINGAKNILWVGQTHQAITKERTPCVV